MLVLPSALLEAGSPCGLPLSSAGQLARELLEMLQALPTISPQKLWAYSHTPPHLALPGLW